MNNSFFGKHNIILLLLYWLLYFLGKTCEDVRKYKNFKIVLNEKTARKLVAKPTMKRAEIYDENLATIELNRSIVTMDKPR